MLLPPLQGVVLEQISPRSSIVQVVVLGCATLALLLAVLRRSRAVVLLAPERKLNLGGSRAAGIAGAAGRSRGQRRRRLGAGPPCGRRPFFGG
jgi:hypothetical protein